MYCDHSELLVMSSRSQVQLAEVSSMALALVTATASGVDCLVAGSVEMPYHDFEAACSVAEPVEVPCLD